MENIDIARLMLAKYGTQNKPFITGLSVYNQRIERLWKDVKTYVVGHYCDLFFWIEESSLLDPLDQFHLYALEVIFTPRINRSLQSFVMQWNHHPMRMVKSKSLIQLWTTGLYENLCADTVVNSDPDINAAEYGINGEGSMTELQTNNDVRIPELVVDIDHIQISQRNPLSNDGNFGVNLYLAVLEYLQTIDSP